MTETVNKAREYAQQGADYSVGMAENVQAMASTVIKDAAEFNVQWIEMVRANTNSSLDFARQLVSVKSPSEFFQLSAEHTRKQFEAVTQQAQHLAGLAQKVTTDAVQPMQEIVKSASKKAT